MLPGWVILASAFGYLLLLFAVASHGDRQRRRFGAPDSGRPVVYALSLAIYCTSWTYFGGVGLASQRGLEFTGIYIGPILVFTLGMPVLRRIIDLAKTEKLTSVADFISARYGKNSAVGTIVALISLVGAIPYIALQLKSVSSTVTAMLNPSDYGIGSGNLYFLDLPLLVTLVLACFAIMFGTRHTDATEHQDGLILAVAMESVVKLFAFLTAGVCVVWFLFDGPADLWRKALENEMVLSALHYQTPISRWLTLTVLSAFAIVMLPRQFHVTVVENRTAKELRLAGFLFPLYLIAINLFVLPMAIAGLLTFGGSGNADLYMLSLPIVGQMPVMSLITFIGGFSAATAMVIVASVALSIMVSNDIVMPIFLRRRLAGRGGQRDDFAKTLLNIRRSAIFAVLLLGYAYYRSTDSTTGLASIGLLSFAAIAQMAPSLLGGLIWRRANARGAILGLSSGFVIWIYLLFLPSLGGPDYSAVASAVLGFVFPGVTVFTDNADPLVNATVMSLLVNTGFFVVGSMTRNARPLERIQAGIFVKRQSRSQFATRGWKTRISVGDLKATISRYLGEERMERSFQTYQQNSGRKLEDDQPADMALIHFTEQLLGSAIGSSSARLVLSLILQKVEDASADTAWLLDQASEALQYNQDMLQTALSQMDQGIAVFDSSNHLTIWNRRFRQLLDLPETSGQVGFPLADIVAILSQRGDIPVSEVSQTVRHFLTLDKPFALVLGRGERIIEVRSNAMPDKGIVATFTDITQRVAADQALKQANETLEQRVAERTAELTRVNHELGEARASADEANLGKTRFFAAAGHDILQPLNAARLYSSALVERMGQSESSAIVRNIDSALESVESILGAVLDISRLDTGAMRPRLASVPLADLLERIQTDFAPIAREKRLKLVVMPTSLRVRSDPNLLRRLVQNLVSNAIKYTLTGKVLVGARRRGNQVVIQVMDSGIGIPPSKFRTVFKEFARLDEGAKTASGLGLGLSIVDRIARVLSHPVELHSTHGKGTDFRIVMPRDISPMAEAPIAAAPAERSAQNLKGLKVLCIDNEPHILEGMQLLLSGWGCAVQSADSLSGVAALDVRDGMPDLVIADYHLGDGTGVAAILSVRERFATYVPGLVITADRTLEVRADAERHGIGIQHKPVRPAALRAYITQISAQKRAAAAE
ncbi:MULTISPECIES: PAS domain-containing hybrid sensor histidine kinase/response regulator [unclassified Rhizobium]|uniref:PAS domain-containing hybrid sensor histidine kinase/response regulator n=1 Tax=unclassified Rhizobium TaxID=2613769 RepID=UPI001ADAAC5C|nr:MULTISPECIES: PAS domain-containing hybrid sensor histidine kinase/response regulator [unclassified Rhizobium]MBO9122620.1 hybrid sensor histidine kinase/response regulator [Rhizobium sp. 16-488-2b]MBO9173151.1 hybrid sensor histidine kinase/response regulator [Rhizobium sp. 16-488-2a]